MSGLRERLKELNEIESPNDRITAALSRLPSPGRCRYILADGKVCQRHRDGQSWCSEHRQIVTATLPAKRSVVDDAAEIVPQPAEAGSD